MLFNQYELHNYLNEHTVKGIIHIGAHECEELTYYHQHLKIDDSKILWIEANPDLVIKAKNKFPQSHIVQGVCSNTEGKEVEFLVTNNFQSSSILPLGTHLKHHPHIHVSGTQKLTTTTLDKIMQEYPDVQRVANFINIDVQGAEKLVLEGGQQTLKSIDYIYAEVNAEELYQGCSLLPQFDEFLLSYGFKRVMTKMTEYRWGDALYVRQ